MSWHCLSTSQKSNATRGLREMIAATDGTVPRLLSASVSRRSLQLPGQRSPVLSRSVPSLSVSDFSFKATVARLHLTPSANNGADWTGRPATMAGQPARWWWSNVECLCRQCELLASGDRLHQLLVPNTPASLPDAFHSTPIRLQYAEDFPAKLTT